MSRFERFLSVGPTLVSASVRGPLLLVALLLSGVMGGATHVLRGQHGDYEAVARRHGDTWYLGAMSDGDSRTLEVELSFLEEGRTYRLTGWRDGPNADRYAEDLQKRGRFVSAGDTVTIEMAPGGGLAGRIRAVRGT